MPAGSPSDDAMPHTQLLVAVTDTLVGFAIVDADGRFIMTNRAFSELTGYTPEELVGAEATMLTHPADLPAAEAARDESAEGGPWPRRQRYLRKDGSEIWVDLIAQPGHDDSEEVAAFAARTFNVDDAQQSSAERDALLTAIEQSPNGYVIVDFEGAITYANAGLCQLLNCTTQKLIGRPFSMLPAPDAADVLDALVTSLLNGQRHARPTRITLLRRDGSPFIAELHGHAVLGPTGEVVGAAAHVVDVTARVAGESAQNRLAALLAQSTYGYLVEHLDGSVADANEALARMAGVTLDGLIAGDERLEQSPADAHRIEGILAPLVAGWRDAVTFHARYQRPDSSVWWAEVSASGLCDQSGRVVGIVKLVRDITQELAERSRLRGVEAQWAELVHNSANGYVLAGPDGDVIDCNRALLDLVDRSRAEVIGAPLISLFSERDRAHARDKLTSALSGAGPAWVRARLAGGSGDSTWADVHLSPVLDDVGNVMNLGGVLHDATGEVAARRRAALAEADLIYRSRHDSLTGVLHRAALLQQIDAVLATDEPATMVFIDIDGFKSVNDHLGHAAGDAALCVLTERIANTLPPTVPIGRLGGDEFGVVLPGAEHATRDAEIAERILEQIRLPITLDGALVQLTASIGLAAVTDSEPTPDAVLRSADVAMYAAKAAGGDRSRRFTTDLAEHATASSRLRNELAAAISKADFEVEYQPILVPERGAMAGVEALVRLRRGAARVPAGDFIGLAEHTGQIVAIGRIVLDLVAGHLTALRDLIAPDGFLTINVSGKELSDAGIIERLADGPLAAGADAIYLEVTEGLALGSAPDTLHTLQVLRDRGYRIAIDDFGTGFSNFARLGALQPDLFKIDRSLVVGARANGSTGRALLAAAVGLARTLQCQVLAEGVENADDHEVVTALPIDYAQGFHYSPSLSLADLARVSRGG